MKHYCIITTALLILVFSSCETITEDTQTQKSQGLLVLNNGTWGGNDSNIAVYDLATEEITPSAFMTANSQALGDLAQDILRVDNRLYIAVYGSQTIFVTDADLKIIGKIDAENNGIRLSPRALRSSGGKLYISYYEGFVGEVPYSSSSVRLTAVGENPEGLDVAGENLYVANSGGMAYPMYGNTISVVSTADFKEISKIEVNANPAKVETSPDDRMVYVSSFGDYASAPAMLQVIETETGKVTDLDYDTVSSIAKGPGGILYILCGGYDENWAPLPGTVYMHDMNKNTPLGKFVVDGTELKNAYSISVTSEGYVAVGCSDYVTTGDVYLFSPAGCLHARFDSCGLNPLVVL